MNEYQDEAAKTAVYPRDYAIVYPVLGLTGESGEVAEKVKKLIRDRGSVVTPGFVEEMTKELGDVLWYLAALARDLGIDLETVAAGNLEKLRSRQERNVLGGSGDNR